MVALLLEYPIPNPATTVQGRHRAYPYRNVKNPTLKSEQIRLPRHQDRYYPRANLFIPLRYRRDDMVENRRSIPTTPIRPA